MRTGWINQQARQILLKKMKDIKGGRLVIESDRVDSVGEAGADDAFAARITVKDPVAFRRLLTGGTTGAAESYIAGEWDVDDLHQLLSIIKINAGVYEGLDSGWAAVSEWCNHLLHAFNKNTKSGSLRNIMSHYDLGNDFFQLFLDETMAYSAGIYESQDSTLKEASIAKFDRICRKLELSASDSVVEIGSGWGGFAAHAAENYGCEVVTTTISKEQYRRVSELVKEKKLDGKVRVLNSDYREMQGVYDKLVSIEMIEAVGHHYLDTFVRKCGSLVKPDGMMAIQAITVPDHRYDRHKYQSSFINKYIFPGSTLISRELLCDRVKKLCGMNLIDEFDITEHYARTLRDWRARFWDNIDKVRSLGLSEEFVRMWHFYLCYCEAGFSQKWLGDYQFVFAGADGE